MSHAFNPRHRVSLAALLFGAVAAPIFWLGQVMLGYGVTAFACYPGDHPVLLSSSSLLPAALVAFNVVASVAALAGFGTAFWCLRLSRAGRSRFLATWGIFSSLCFFAAILFNIIASATVPLCLR